MTAYDIASAQQWIERNHAALAALDVNLRDEDSRRLSAGIRSEIARVERLIALYSRACDEEEFA